MALLDIGYGATSGLETMLADARAKETLAQRQKQLDEEARSNKANEGLELLKLQDSMGQRQAATSATQQNREFAQAQKREGDYSIGQEVPRSVAQQNVNATGDSTLYKSPDMASTNITNVIPLVSAQPSAITGGPKPSAPTPTQTGVVTSPNALQEPSSFLNFTGTGKQQEQAKKDADVERRLTDAENKPKSPTETDLALLAAQGDPDAIRAMRLLKPPSAAQQALNAPEPAVLTTRPSGPDANKPDPKVGGLTPNAVFQSAVDFALTNRMPSVGLGSTGAAGAKRTAVQNTAAALAAQVGVDLPTLQAEYRANAGTLNKLLPQATATANASHTATDNLNLALSQSDQVSRTGAKLVNRYLQWAQGELTAAKDLTQFEVYIYTAAREYAKVTSGGAGSTQGLTDSAAKEAEKLLSAAQSPAAFGAATEAMKNDMSNVVSEQANGLARVSDTIGSFFAGVNGVTVKPPPPGNSLDVKKPTKLIYDPATGTVHQ